MASHSPLDPTKGAIPWRLNGRDRGGDTLGLRSVPPRHRNQSDLGAADVLPTDKVSEVFTTSTRKEPHHSWETKVLPGRKSKLKGISHRAPERFRSQYLPQTHAAHYQEKFLKKWSVVFFFPWEKEHLTKGTKILRIKSQVGAVKDIRIKHCKYKPEFTVLPQARPHCHLLNKSALFLGLVFPECFLNIHSGTCGHSVFPPSRGSLATGQEAPSGSRQHHLLWRPPTRGNVEVTGWQNGTVRHWLICSMTEVGGRRVQMNARRCTALRKQANHKATAGKKLLTSVWARHP